MKTRTKVILIIVAVLLAGIATGVISIVSMARQAEKVDLTVADVDLTNARDGTYTGTCEAFPVYAEVKVTVKGGRIDDIQLIKHRNGQGGAAEVIPSKVVEAQSVQVDTITGATSSSKVIRKAIENALKEAIK